MSPLSLVDDAQETPPRPQWSLAALGSIAATTAGKVETLAKDFDEHAKAQVQATKALHSEFALVRKDIEGINNGVLEAIAIGKSVERRQSDDAKALRESDAMLDTRTGNHAAQIAVLRSILEPVVADAAREGSRQGTARATKAMGAVGGVGAIAVGLAQYLPTIVEVFGKASAPVGVGVVVLLAFGLWLARRQRASGSIPPPAKG